MDSISAAVDYFLVNYHHRMLLMLDFGSLFRHSPGSAEFSHSNSYRQVLLSGIPFGNTRNIHNDAWCVKPNEAISL